MSEKLTARHLERDAYIYIRQSTNHQVRHNKESQRRQYALVDRARNLGFERVEVVDEDLGVSGSGMQKRPGFARLLASVCEGRVGGVFALEASRLARNNRDWHHLIDLCALTQTVVVDDDGIYDPQQLNDRLLLGLKGTMSEFELGLIRQRAREALRQMIRRGAVITELPVGYVRTENHECELSPDRQVQAAVRSVFAKFLELGTARQVLLWYRQEDLRLPSPKPASRGYEVVWRAACYSRILAILKNPTYTGTFVHGRRKTKTRVVRGRARKTQGVEVALEDWAVVIHDHHPAYITWDQYLRHQQMLKNNSNMQGRTRSAVRGGAALLAGLLRCGRCGRKLQVTYVGRAGRQLARYVCRSSHVSRAEKKCISFAARKVDQAVASLALEAVQPAGVEAALHAWDRMSKTVGEKRIQLQLAAEKVRYEADRAQRQFDAVEPENRLVAAELERRWNEALGRRQEAEERLREVEASSPPLVQEDRARLLELGRDLKTAWDHSEAPVELRKRILRTLIKEIVADLAEDTPVVVLVVHWSGGVHTHLRVRKNRSGEHRRVTHRDVIALVRELSHTCTDQQVAQILNRLGYQTGAGKSWTQSRVDSVRRKQGIPALSRGAKRAWLTLEQAAGVLEVSRGFVKRLLDEGVLPGRQVVEYAPWVIERASLDLPEVQAAIASRARGRRPRPQVGQKSIPFLSTT
ncbi:MAG: recombinase family protein [Acidobacteriota bacterium]